MWIFHLGFYRNAISKWWYILRCIKCQGICICCQPLNQHFISVSCNIPNDISAHIHIIFGYSTWCMCFCLLRVTCLSSDPNHLFLITPSDLSLPSLACPCSVVFPVYDFFLLWWSGSCLHVWPWSNLWFEMFWNGLRFNPFAFTSRQTAWHICSNPPYKLGLGVIKLSFFFPFHFLTTLSNNTLK